MAGVRAALEAGRVVSGQSKRTVGLHAILGQSVDTVLVGGKVMGTVLVSGESMSLALVGRWVWLLSWIIGRVVSGEGVWVVLVGRERRLIGREGVVEVEVARRRVRALLGSTVGREDQFLWAITT